MPGGPSPLSLFTTQSYPGGRQQCSKLSRRLWVWAPFSRVYTRRVEQRAKKKPCRWPLCPSPSSHPGVHSVAACRLPALNERTTQDGPGLAVGFQPDAVDTSLAAWSLELRHTVGHKAKLANFEAFLAPLHTTLPKNDPTRRIASCPAARVVRARPRAWPGSAACRAIARGCLGSSWERGASRGTTVPSWPHHMNPSFMMTSSHVCA